MRVRNGLSGFREVDINEIFLMELSFFFYRLLM